MNGDCSVIEIVGVHGIGKQSNFSTITENELPQAWYFSDSTTVNSTGKTQ